MGRAHTENRTPWASEEMMQWKGGEVQGGEEKDGVAGEVEDRWSSPTVQTCFGGEGGLRSWRGRECVKN